MFSLGATFKKIFSVRNAIIFFDFEVISKKKVFTSGSLCHLGVQAFKRNLFGDKLKFWG